MTPTRTVRIGWILVALGGSVAVAGCTASDCVDPTQCTSSPSDCAPGTLGCIPQRLVGTSSPSDSESVSYALRGIVLNQPGDRWKSVGFDLDGVETSSASRVGSCSAPNASSATLDGSGGIDNVFGSNIYPNLIGVLFPTMETDLCCFETRGRGTLVLRIDGWNGERDDDQVIVSLGTSVDATSAPVTDVVWSATERGLVSNDGITPAPAPSWAPDSSSFYVGSGDFTPGSAGDWDALRHRDVTAYIRDGYIVMHVDPAQPISFSFADVASLPIRLVGGTIVAHMSADGSKIDSGVIGGRLGADGMLDMVTAMVANDINFSGDVPAQCSVYSGIVNQVVSQYADVTTSLDDSLPDATCDAVSVGIGFNGVRARSLEVGGGTLCTPRVDCTSFQTLGACDPIPETFTNGGAQAPVCYLGPTVNGFESTGGCDPTDWNAPSP